MDDAGPASVIAVVPGKFRPPHRGHLGMVARLARCCSAVIVVVQSDTTTVRAPGGGRQVSAELATTVWKTCLPYVVSPDNAANVFVVIADAEEVCHHVVDACAAVPSSTSVQAVLVAGQEALCVPANQALPMVLLPKEAHVCSTAMATVPLWASPGDDAHIAHVVDCLPASLPNQVAQDIARAVAGALTRQGTRPDAFA